MRLAIQIQALSDLNIHVLERNSTVIIYCRCVAVRVYSNPQGNPSPPLPGTETYSIFSVLLCHREREISDQSQTTGTYETVSRLYSCFSIIRLCVWFVPTWSCILVTHSLNKSIGSVVFPIRHSAENTYGFRWWETKRNSYFFFQGVKFRECGIAVQFIIDGKKKTFIYERSLFPITFRSLNLYGF